MKPAISLRRSVLSALLAGLAALLLALPASAIVFYDTADSAHNTAAPTGVYADSGWQYQGYFGTYMGTMISPTHFITAAHIGVQSGSFVYDSVFSGGATQTYTIDTSANGGLGYYDIAGTDLRIYQITGGTFSTYAQIYTGSLDVGSQFVVMGRGGPRGVAVNLAPDGLKGWLTAGPDGIARWGVNTFDAAATINGYSMLVADFDAIPGLEEAHLSNGDSGGAAFIYDGGVWKLAGINYAVEGAFDADSDHTSGVFNAALFDKGGFYRGNGASWTFLPDTLTDAPSQLYLSRISASGSEIQSVIAVPEPGSAVLLCIAGAGLLLNRRRTHR